MLLGTLKQHVPQNLLNYVNILLMRTVTAFVVMATWRVFFPPHEHMNQLNGSLKYRKCLQISTSVNNCHACQEMSQKVRNVRLLPQMTFGI